MYTSQLVNFGLNTNLRWSEILQIRCEQIYFLKPNIMNIYTSFQFYYNVYNAKNTSNRRVFPSFRQVLYAWTILYTHLHWREIILTDIPQVFYNTQFRYIRAYVQHAYMYVSFFLGCLPFMIKFTYYDFLLSRCNKIHIWYMLWYI